MIIDKSSVLVQYCTFSGNEASIDSTLSTITIDSCNFVNNSLTGCDPEYHRKTMITAVNGPQTSKSVTVTNCNFNDNQILHYEYPGTLLFIDGSTLVLNNSFTSNIGFRNDILHVNTEIIIDHKNVYDNEVYRAVVYVNGIHISTTISHNNFANNTATAVLLHVSDSVVTISDSDFRNYVGNFLINRAVAIGPGEYNVYDCSLKTSVMIIGCTFVNDYNTLLKLWNGAVDICTDTGSVSIIYTERVC